MDCQMCITTKVLPLVAPSNRHLHAPMLVSTWNAAHSGLGAALPLSLSIDSQYQVVGGKPIFTLIGAPPGAPVLWSSYFNGQATGEFNTAYAGQVVEANGTAQLEGGVWTAAQAGTWTKEVLVQGPDGANYRAKIDFVVQPAAAAAPAAPAPSSGGFSWTQPLFNLGTFAVTPAVLGIGAIVFYFFTKKK